MKRKPLPKTATPPLNRLLPILFLFQLLIISALGQNSPGLTVRGIITDEKNEALVGVNVVEKNTQRGTVSDAKGNFTFHISDENAVLVFSLIGYTTIEVKANKRSALTISMVTDMKGLDEVVVIGYGSVKKYQ